MTTSSEASQARPKRRRLVRLIGGGIAVLILLIVVGYFVATSSAFLKSVILPKVSQRLGAQITVADASVSPFSQVRLTGLNVQTAGEEPLLTAQEVDVKYSLWEILRGNYRLESITLLQPAMQWVQHADGTSNLDPILKALAAMEAGTAAQPESTVEPSEPLSVELVSLNLEGGTIRMIRQYEGAQQDLLEIHGAELTLQNVKNGQTATLKFKADLKVELDSPALGAPGSMRSTLAGEFQLGLSPTLEPTQVQGNARLEVAEAAGILDAARSLAVVLETDITPQAIRQAALRAFQGQNLLAELTCDGPFDLAKREGRLSLAAHGIDHQVLNLAGSAFGVDFGRTSIQSTNLVTLTNHAQAIQITGRLDVAQFSLTRSNLTTPTIDLGLVYDADADLAAGRAVLRALELDGRQDNRPLLTGGLVKPMSLDWSSGQAGPEEFALRLTLTNLNLADWAQFTGGQVSSGRIGAQVDLTSRQAGRQLLVRTHGRCDGLSAAMGTNQLDQLDLIFELEAQMEAFKQVLLRQADVQLAHAGDTFAHATARGTLHVETLDAELDSSLRLVIPAILNLLPLPEAHFTDGVLAIQAHVGQKPGGDEDAPLQTLTGTLELEPLSGRLADVALDRLAATGNFDLQLQGTRLAIRQLDAALTQAAEPAGRLDLSGQWDLQANRGRIQLVAEEVNQRLLAPFATPALAGKQLRSVSIQADTRVEYDPAAASLIRGNLSVTNLVVFDPTGALPAKPLAARAKLDTALAGQVIELRQTRLELDRTERADNAVVLTGKVDFSDTNAITGNLNLTAASVDLTPWYDLFMSGPGLTAGSSAPPQPAPPAGPETEPPAIQLPLKNFVLDAEIGTFYLREVSISNLQTHVVIDGGHVVVQPARLTLNGAPAEAAVDLDLGLPGYRYDLSLKAAGIPLAPLVNTFQPDRKGQIAGTLTAEGAIRGAGITGTSLQKNLAGQFQFATTNMNLKVVNVRSSILKSILNVIIALPDLIRNPQEAVTGLVGTLAGALSGNRAEGQGGWVEEVAQSPINVIESEGHIGDGVVNLTRAFVGSSAFQIETHGTIRLASVLTNSTLELPVMVALRRELAAKVGLVPGNTPTNTVFVQLPHFLTMQGTVGEPKKKLNLVALLKITSKVATGLVGNTGEAAVDQATGTLEAVGGLFGLPIGGNSSPQQPAEGTDTNQPPAAGPKLPKLPLNPFKLFDRN